MSSINDVEVGGDDRLNASAPLLPLAVSSAESVQTYDDEHKRRYSAHKGWAYAFRLNVLVTVLAACWSGYEAIEAFANDSLSGEGRRRLMNHNHGDHSPHHDHDSEGGSNLSNFIVGLVALLAIATLVSAGMMHSLFHCGPRILATSFAVCLGIVGAIATIGLLKVPFFLSIVFFVIFVYGVVALRRRKHRLAFASANLKVASMALKKMPWTYRSAVVMGIVQFLWCGVAAIAALGSFIALETVTAPDGSSYRAIHCWHSFDDSPDATSSCTCSGAKISDEECHFSGLGFPLMVVWLCSMGWGCAVIKNVVACTVSGSVASWWFTPKEDSTPVKGAFHRATTSSFGSLCKAGAVQHLVAAVCSIARRWLRYVPCACILLTCVNKAVTYGLSYTVTFVGIYGLSFDEAGGRVKEMFKRRAVSTLANDVVVEVGLVFLAVSATIVYMLMAGMLAYVATLLDDNDDKASVVDSFAFWSSVVGPQIFGVVALVFLVHTALEVVRSGYKAVFVCFVQDPEMLAEKHGHEVHAELQSAWQSMHGSENNDDGDARRP